MTANLEKQITAALGGDVSAARCAQLIDELEAALAQAENAAAAARESAYDPSLTSDLPAAQAAMETTALRVGRLQTLQPRLQARYQERLDAEQHASWEADYKRVKTQIAEAALAWEDYPQLIADLCALFDTAAKLEAAAARVNASAPSGEQRRLRGVELTARKLDSFSAANPSIAETARLPAFDTSDSLAWPPPAVPFAVLATAAVTAALPRFAPGSPEEKEARAAARRADNERLTAYYEARKRA